MYVCSYFANLHCSTLMLISQYTICEPEIESYYHHSNSYFVGLNSYRKLNSECDSDIVSLCLKEVTLLL